MFDGILNLSESTGKEAPSGSTAGAFLFTHILPTMCTVLARFHVGTGGHRRGKEKPAEPFYVRHERVLTGKGGETTAIGSTSLVKR